MSNSNGRYWSALWDPKIISRGAGAAPSVSVQLLISGQGPWIEPPGWSIRLCILQGVCFFFFFFLQGVCLFLSSCPLPSAPLPEHSCSLSKNLKSQKKRLFPFYRWEIFTTNTHWTLIRSQICSNASSWWFHISLKDWGRFRDRVHILQTMRPEPREVRTFAQDHTAHRWESSASTFCWVMLLLPWGPDGTPGPWMFGPRGGGSPRVARGDQPSPWQDAVRPPHQETPHLTTLPPPLEPSVWLSSLPRLFAPARSLPSTRTPHTFAGTVGHESRLSVEVIFFLF